MKIKQPIGLNINAALARVIVVVALIFWDAMAGAAEEPIQVNPVWTDIGAVLKTHLALQVCPEPPMYRGKPLHNPIYRALRELNADYNRLQPWTPFPRMSVAELTAPGEGTTYWDFTLMDQIVTDFMQAVGGRPVVFSINTIPEWMNEGAPLKRDAADQDAIDWSYGSKTKFSDALVKQFADYEARIASWYIKGGFHDEYGRWHPSSHFYNNIEYWEPLNEPDSFTPSQVTQLYDAVVDAIRKIVPGMKFSGPSLAPEEVYLADSNPRRTAEHFQYFLDPKHHQAGVPINLLSYHIYTTSDLDETPVERPRTLFANADAFLMQARAIDVARQQYLPSTKTVISELGTQVRPQMAENFSVPQSYWNLTAAVWAYLYINLAAIGVDIVNGAELIDYPGNWAGSTFINWETGQPRPVYRVLQMLNKEFRSGDQLIKSTPEEHLQQMSKLTAARHLYYQGVRTASGEKKVLLINRSDQTLNVQVPGAAGGKIEYVDGTTGSQPPTEKQLESEQVPLGAYAVAVVVLAK